MFPAIVRTVIAEKKNLPSIPRGNAARGFHEEAYCNGSEKSVYPSRSNDNTRKTKQVRSQLSSALAEVASKVEQVSDLQARLKMTVKFQTLSSRPLQQSLKPRLLRKRG